MLILMLLSLLVAASTAADRPVPEVASPEGAAASVDTLRSVRFNGEEVPYDIFGEYLLPGDSVTIEVARGTVVTATAGDVHLVSASTWQWRAPQAPGLYPITIGRADQAPITINAFVQYPRSQSTGGMLNGYRIGSYPDRVPNTPNHAEAYAPPRGFVEVTAVTADVQVSPHFRLGQFVCKDTDGYPKYVALSPRLVHQLELILAEVNRRGMRVSTFHVMSGFRTPAYNRGGGNVEFSRHQFGDASDIFIDRDGNGTMDDLNGDGRVGRADAKYLYDVIERMESKPGFTGSAGGLGYYGATSAHGPFVHVDVRGFRTRWKG